MRRPLGWGSYARPRVFPRAVSGELSYSNRQRVGFDSVRSSSSLPDARWRWRVAEKRLSSSDHRVREANMRAEPTGWPGQFPVSTFAKPRPPQGATPVVPIRSQCTVVHGPTVILNSYPTLIYISRTAGNEALARDVRDMKAAFDILTMIDSPDVRGIMRPQRQISSYA